VFEYVKYDLKKYLKAKPHHLSEEEVKKLVYQLCAGIEYCHAHRILHRDLKP